MPQPKSMADQVALLHSQKMAPLSDQASTKPLQKLKKKRPRKSKRSSVDPAKPPHTSSSTNSSSAKTTPLTQLPSTPVIEEIQDATSAELKVIKWIVLRETYLDRLVGISSSALVLKKELKATLGELLQLLRRITIEIVSAVTRWRELLGDADAPFDWGGNNYLVKIAGDTQFMHRYESLESYLGMSFQHNPFFYFFKLDGTYSNLPGVPKKRQGKLPACLTGVDEAKVKECSEIIYNECIKYNVILDDGEGEVYEFHPDVLAAQEEAQDRMESVLWRGPSSNPANSHFTFHTGHNNNSYHGGGGGGGFSSSPHHYGSTTAPPRARFGHHANHAKDSNAQSLHSVHSLLDQTSRTVKDLYEKTEYRAQEIAKQGPDSAYPYFITWLKFHWRCQKVKRMGLERERRTKRDVLFTWQQFAHRAISAQRMAARMLAKRREFILANLPQNVARECLVEHFNAWKYLKVMVDRVRNFRSGRGAKMVGICLGAWMHYVRIEYGVRRVRKLVMFDLLQDVFFVWARAVVLRTYTLERRLKTRHKMTMKGKITIRYIVRSWKDFVYTRRKVTKVNRHVQKCRKYNAFYLWLNNITERTKLITWDGTKRLATRLLSQMINAKLNKATLIAGMKRMFTRKEDDSWRKTLKSGAAYDKMENDVAKKKIMEEEKKIMAKKKPEWVLNEDGVLVRKELEVDEDIVKRQLFPKGKSAAVDGDEEVEVEVEEVGDGEEDEDEEEDVEGEDKEVRNILGTTEMPPAEIKRVQFGYTVNDEDNEQDREEVDGQSESSWETDSNASSEDNSINNKFFSMDVFDRDNAAQVINCAVKLYLYRCKVTKRFGRQLEAVRRISNWWIATNNQLLKSDELINKYDGIEYFNAACKLQMLWRTKAARWLYNKIKKDVQDRMIFTHASAIQRKWRTKKGLERMRSFRKSAKLIQGAFRLHIFWKRMAAVDQDGNNALLNAAKCSNMELLKRLLEKGWKLTATNRKEQNALHLACSSEHSGSLEVVELILDHDWGEEDDVCDVNAVDEKGWTALHHATFTGKSKVILALLSKGAILEVYDQYGLNCLHLAVDKDRRKALQVLIDAGHPLDVGDPDGSTGLHLAAIKNHLRCGLMLFEAGAAIDYQDSEGKTPLHCAIVNSNPKFLQMLLNNGAHPDVVDGLGRTGLHLSVHARDIDMLKMLCDCGCNINAVDSDGNTCLHWAAQTDAQQLVKLLLRNGADSTISNVYDQQARQVALLNGFEKCSHLIMGQQIHALPTDDNDPMAILMSEGVAGGNDVDESTVEGYHTRVLSDRSSLNSYDGVIIENGARFDDIGMFVHTTYDSDSDNDSAYGKRRRAVGSPHTTSKSPVPKLKFGGSIGQMVGKDAASQPKK